jgi:hypothetical protein
VPQNGEANEKPGVYKSLCCGAEIVVNVSSMFPDCPNHRKLTTTWKMVSEPTAVPAPETKKADSNPAELHVENRRLVDLASGRVKLDGWEEHHLHTCKLCQGVLYVFINQPIDAPPEKPPKSADAA